MNDTFLIHIEIAGKKYPLNIRREDEEIMRAAAKQINMKVLQYQNKYGTRMDVRDWLAITALQLSKENLILEEKHNISPFEEKVRELTNELGEYLKSE